MQGLEQILASNGTNLEGLAARFGLSPDQARSAMGSLMPAIVGGLHKQAAAGDPADVAGAAASVTQPDTATGNDILGRIFGSKDVSRQVADHAAGQSGVAADILKSMLPVAAAMLARHLGSGGAQSTGGGGGLGGMLASVMGGGGGFSGGGQNPLDAILGRLR